MPVPFPLRLCWWFHTQSSEAVCDVSGDLSIGIIEGVASLVENSLLQSVKHAEDEPRFRMLETIREFGLDVWLGVENKNISKMLMPTICLLLQKKHPWSLRVLSRGSS